MLHELQQKREAQGRDGSTSHLQGLLPEVGIYSCLNNQHWNIIERESRSDSGALKQVRSLYDILRSVLSGFYCVVPCQTLLAPLSLLLMTISCCLGFCWEAIGLLRGIQRMKCWLSYFQVLGCLCHCGLRIGEAYSRPGIGSVVYVKSHRTYPSGRTRPHLLFDFW